MSFRNIVGAILVISMAGCAHHHREHHNDRQPGAKVVQLPDPQRPIVDVIDIGGGNSTAVVNQEPIVLSRAHIRANLDLLRAQGVARIVDRGVEVKLSWLVRTPKFNFRGEPGRPQSPGDKGSGIRIDSVTEYTSQTTSQTAKANRATVDSTFRDCVIDDASRFSCWVAVDTPLKFTYTIQLVDQNGKAITVDPTGVIY